MTEPADLAELRSARHVAPPWLLRLIQPEVGGGRTDASGLAVIEQHPRARALEVSGLDQRTFEHLVTDYGAQFDAIRFWKCPRITDLTPLEDLPGLRLVSFYWNQRTTRLWDLSRNPRLAGLHFDDLTRLHDLADLRQGTALRELEFGDAVWSTSTFESLEPLAGLDRLQSLTFSAKRIDDGRIQPLGALSNLQQLGCPANLFTTQQVAWLRARLPESVRSDSLGAILPLRRPLELGGRSRDVRLVGRRKPFLNSITDARRIARHVEEFDRAVADFRAHPERQPD
jgi:hypothetical protein